jgi:hypothetical protein
MKIDHVMIGLLIVLAFLAGRWSNGYSPAGPANAPIAGGVKAPLAAKEPTQPSYSAKAAPAPPVLREWVEQPAASGLPPVSDTPEVVRNNGAFIDADPDKTRLRGPDQDQPARNTGPFIEVGGPPISRGEGAVGVSRK